jgi:hypothetical protein
LIGRSLNHINNAADRTKGTAMNLLLSKRTKVTAADDAASPVVIRADFSSADATRRWWAIGGGADLDEALAWAWSSLPDGERWCLTGWRSLYGD